MNLRDNPDGTCNCRPLGRGCFFTDGFDGPCDCKCHSRPTPPTEDRDWKETLRIKLYNFGRLSDRQELSDEQESIEEFIESEITTAEARGRGKGIELAARIVEQWHIKKGGYTELAHIIRAHNSQTWLTPHRKWRRRNGTSFVSTTESGWGTRERRKSVWHGRYARGVFVKVVLDSLSQIPCGEKQLNGSGTSSVSSVLMTYVTSSGNLRQNFTPFQRRHINYGSNKAKSHRELQK